MNVITIQTHGGIVTRVRIGCEASAINLVAYAHRLPSTRHVSLEDVNVLIPDDRDHDEIERSHIYVQGFFKETC